MVSVLALDSYDSNLIPRRPIDYSIKCCLKRANIKKEVKAIEQGLW